MPAALRAIGEKLFANAPLTEAEQQALKELYAGQDEAVDGVAGAGYDGEKGESYYENGRGRVSRFAEDGKDDLFSAGGKSGESRSRYYEKTEERTGAGRRIPEQAVDFVTRAQSIGMRIESQPGGYRAYGLADSNILTEEQKAAALLLEANGKRAIFTYGRVEIKRSCKFK